MIYKPSWDYYDDFIKPNFELLKTNNMLQTEPIIHTDIHGKLVYYLKITNGISVQFINVNERTYNKVKELETVKDQEQLPELPFEGINPQNQQHGEENTTGTEGSPEHKVENVQPERGPRNGRSNK